MPPQLKGFLLVLGVGVGFYAAGRYFDDSALRTVSFILFGASLPVLSRSATTERGNSE